MALAWSLANPFGIQWGTSGWHAGRLHDVLELDTSSVLVASATGGVWLLTASLGIPLSLDWEAPDVNALARGPNGPRHVFAGGTTADRRGALWETDVSQSAPLLASWRRIAFPAGAGEVNRIAVDGRRLVVATTMGVLIATVPTTAGAPYEFVSVAGFGGAQNITALGIAANRRIVAASAGVLWYDPLITALPRMRVASVTGIDPARLTWTALAVAPSDPSRVYAASCEPVERTPEDSDEDHFVGVLRSVDGGRSYTLRSSLRRGTEALLHEHSQKGWTGAVAVHPTDRETLVLGYTAGPYVSRDGAATLSPTERALTHDDKTMYRFNAAGRLYETSDGGVSYTNDLGETFVSLYDRRLANLQFLGPSAQRQGWGRATASYQVPGLFGGGLQDNSDVYSTREDSGAARPWQSLSPGVQIDGQAVLFPRTGGALFTLGDGRVASWEPPRLVPLGAIPVGTARPGTTGAGQPLPTGPLTLVNSPQWRNSGGELMYAVASSRETDLYGLFAAPDGVNMHWEYLATLPLGEKQVISAVSSATGRFVLAGVRGKGEVWRVHVADGNRLVRSSGLESQRLDWDAVVVDLIIHREGGADRTGGVWEAYALWTDFPTNSSRLYSTTDGVAWSLVTTTGLPRSPSSPTDMTRCEPLYCFATDWTVSPQTLYAGTDDRVYASRDRGRSWFVQSSGLPRRAHCSDLGFVVQPDGLKLLYLATFGWSTWVSRVE